LSVWTPTPPPLGQFSSVLVERFFITLTHPKKQTDKTFKRAFEGFVGSFFIALTHPKKRTDKTSKRGF
jgi:hypothetical protein